MGGNNWDLHAVVRSCVGPTASSPDRDPFSSFCSSPAVADDVDVDAGLDIFVLDRPPVIQELEELYKPFFRSPSIPPSRPPDSEDQQQRQRPPPLFGLQQGQRRRRPQLQRSLSEPAHTKKRKKQQKKVICHVPADGLSTDVWAWRKYGQKPIKGSPYPRGYYRCSSSKGCPARKQVERNRMDPGVFLIAYTAEHNHPIPAHRNSVARGTRNSAAPKVNSSDGVNEENVNKVSTSSAAPEVGEEDEGMLMETDVGMLGVDDDVLLAASLDGPGRPPPEKATSTATAVPGDLPDQFTPLFSPP